MRHARFALALTLLIAAGLACSTVEDFFTLEGPEDLATDVVGTPAVATPSGGLPYTLDEADDAQAALRPEFAADAALLPDASRYVIDVAVSFNGDGSATLTGRELIRYTNREGFALEALYLMLWPNERLQYLGEMELGRVRVGGEAVEPEMEFRNLAARLPLAEPLAPGAAVEVEAEFVTRAEPGLERGARFGLTRGALIAPTFYPLIPRLVDGAWQVEPPPGGGDTTNSDSAFYAWRVTAPAGMEIAASGTVVDAALGGGAQTQVLLTGPMRDLALVVGDLDVSQRDADGVLLNAYLLPTHAELAGDVLDQAAAQVETLTALVGPYPFAELDIIDAPGAFGGIEYPGLILIGVIDEDGSYETANVHEVGHQWFYSLIGDDQLLEPWLDEAAASYTEILYAEHAVSAAAARRALDDNWDYLEWAGDPTRPIGLPVADYDDDYGLIVYGKGTLFFDALRRELGDGVFFDFLRAYFDRYRYGFATSAGFQEAAEETCACDLDALFDLWVYEGGPVERP